MLPYSIRKAQGLELLGLFVLHCLNFTPFACSHYTMFYNILKYFIGPDYFPSKTMYFCLLSHKPSLFFFFDNLIFKFKRTSIENKINITDTKNAPISSFSHAIIFPLLIPNLATEGGVSLMEILNSFLLSILASIVAACICKWLNGK